MTKPIRFKMHTDPVQIYLIEFTTEKSRPGLFYFPHEEVEHLWEAHGSQPGHLPSEECWCSPRIRHGVYIHRTFKIH